MFLKCYNKFSVHAPNVELYPLKGVKMNFLNEIKNKKHELKTCQTVVTSIEGNKYIECKDDKGEVKITKLNEKCSGFIVNDKPDLQVAEILPYLYLASQDVAQDIDILTENNITHVLSIGVSLVNPNHEKIKFQKVDLLDEPNSDISEVLSSSFKFIETAKLENENNKILVHCNAGYSRAPTIIIGYLMKKYGYTLNEGFKIVNQKRNIKPNEGFLKQLRMLEQIKTDL